MELDFTKIDDDLTLKLPNASNVFLLSLHRMLAPNCRTIAISDVS